MSLFKPDAWSALHLTGCYCWARVFSHIPGIVLWEAALFALMMGAIWELADDAFAGKWIFDPRGADGVDLAFDAAGAGLTLLI